MVVALNFLVSCLLMNVYGTEKKKGQSKLPLEDKKNVYLDVNQLRLFLN
jgi:hypothetical protein